MLSFLQAEPLWMRVMQRCRPQLVDNLLTRKALLLDAMIAEGLLTILDVETHNNTTDEPQRRSALLNHVISQGEAGFIKFVRLLCTDFRPLAELLCQETWREWMCEDLVEAPSSTSVKLTQIRSRYKRRELRLFSMLITTAYDNDFKLLFDVQKMISCECHELNGDFMYPL